MDIHEKSFIVWVIILAFLWLYNNTVMCLFYPSDTAKAYKEKSFTYWLYLMLWITGSLVFGSMFLYNIIF